MSGKIYYMSDPHFGHKYAAFSRGFRSVEAHDYAIVNGVIDTVKKKDTLWILGDITMEKPQYDILEEFTSRGIYLKVVLGNHDKGAHVKALLNHVNSVQGVSEVTHMGRRVWLTHIPMDNTELEKYDEYNIHGHIHEKKAPTDRHINVSMDQLEDFKPKTIEELFKDKMLVI